ncbi:MAG: PAS domain S-box protein [Spirochaetia bacterium]|nr:PAS domain S-box protein [Spirochaetia bacterium]
MTKKILLVEDEAIIAMNQAQILKKHGYEIVTVHNGEKAIEAVDSDPDISLILMDIDLGKGMDGTKATEKILSRHELPIVFLTSHSEKEMVDRVKGITRYGYVLKNSGEFVLIESINMAYELFEAHSEVQEREKRYKSIFYNSHSPMMLIEPATGNIVDVNPSASEFYGWPRVVLSNMKVQDINQLSHEEVLKEMERAREEERNVFYFKHKLSDGSIKDVEVRSSPISVKGKQLLYSIIQDITEKTIAVENLRKSEEQFRAIVEENPEPLFIQTEMKFAYLNPAALKLFGANTASDLIGTPVMDRFHPDFHSAVSERINSLNEERKTVHNMNQIYLKSGRHACMGRNDRNPNRVPGQTRCYSICA